MCNIAVIKIVMLQLYCVRRPKIAQQPSVVDNVSYKIWSTSHDGYLNYTARNFYINKRVY